MAVFWRERYGCYSLSLRTISLQVSWSTDRAAPGYVVKVGAQQLKELAPDIDTGQARAIAHAKKVLAKDLSDLSES